MSIRMFQQIKQPKVTPNFVTNICLKRSTLKKPGLIEFLNMSLKTRSDASPKFKVSGGDADELQWNEKIADKMSNQNLAILQNMFQSSNNEGSIRGLNSNEFEHALKIAFGRIENQNDLENLFVKADKNCDGIVDWEEFCSFMLFENEQKTTFSNENSDILFPKGAKEVSHPHHDTIVMLGYFPTLGNIQKSTNETDEYSESGRYISVSKDGLFVFWSLDLQIQRVLHLSESLNGKLQKMWVTDVICLANVKKIVVSTTDRHIIFYDCSGTNFEKQCIVTGLEHPVLCMDYWYCSSDLNHSCLLLGDAGGSVSCITFTLATVGLFDVGIDKHKRTSHSNVRKIPYLELVSGRHHNVSAVSFNKLHEDWVRKVKYIPTLRCFISCANTSQTSLVLGDLQTKKIKTSFKMKKGVYTFDFDKENSVIVTGGLDCYVRLWNPYVNHKASSVLKGHNSAVVQVIVYGEKIISFSRDKLIKVWNTRDHSCLQTIHSCFTEFSGVHPFTAAYFNKKEKTLLLGSNTILILEKNKQNLEVNVADEGSSHPKPLCGALYNPLFNQVVSACHGSVVNVWNALTGEKVILLANAHDGQEITALTFDKSMRKLITGSRGGIVKIWNFNNGEVVREIKALDGNEVTGFACPYQHIVVVGWNHKIHVYSEFEDKPIKKLNNIHKDDITSIDSLDSGVIVTVSFDGQLSCWNIKTGRTCFQHSINNINKRTSESSTAKSSVTKKIFSIDKVLFLKAREVDRETATILVSAGGTIQAWSSKCGFLGQFEALADLRDGSIFAMKSDEKNNFLFTGDSSGFIRVWDISKYFLKDCKSGRESESALNALKKSDQKNISSSIGKFYQKNSFTSLNVSEKVITESNPPNHSTFRAHVQSIVSLDYIETKMLIVSASNDCCVRLWSITGCFLGTFGQKDPFNANENIHYSKILSKIPTDLQRTGSPKMTQVLRGARQKWKLVRNVFRLLSLKKKRSRSSNINLPKIIPKKINSEIPQIDSDKQNSKSILGKCYEPKQHHRTPKVIKTKINQSQCVVFSSLEIVKLSSFDVKLSNVFNEEGSSKQYTTFQNPGQIDRKRHKVNQNSRTCMKNISNKNNTDSLPSINLSR